MGNYDKHKTWIGLGVQTGGGILAGFEHIDGGIFNLGSLSRNYGFKINSARLGLRAGFSNSLIAALVFNCSNVQQLHGMAYSSNDLSLAIGAKWDSLANSLKQYQFFTTLCKIMYGGKIAKNLEDLEKINKGVEHFFFLDEVEEALETPVPKFVNLGIAGMGFDVGFSHSFGGKIEIY